MRKVMGCALLVAGAGLSTAASAEVYVGGMGNYFKPDSARYNADDGWGARALVGYKAERVMFELSFLANTYEPENGSGNNGQTGFGADVLFPFGTGTFRPYTVFGVNYIEESIFSEEETAFAGDLGLGALVKILPNLDLRMEGRYMAVFNDLGGAGEDPFYDLTAGIGVQSYFGGKEAAVAPTACTDSDGDGVCDEADLCPGTPVGTKVDAKGCPIVETMAKPEANQKLGTVYFAFDKADLSSEAMATLDSAAMKIGELGSAYPDLKVEVSGHTDWIGTDGYNQGLSERRANTTKSYLVRKGVDSSKISVFAYGETRPVAPNANADGSDNAEGRAMNRRAEVESRGQ